MCGIVGYVGKRNAQDVLLDGLEKLEYRGYDSAGVALALEGGIRVVKSKGRLAELRKRLAVEALARSGCGIGHTRWATHGEPSDVNSHPHSTPRVSIVHNGIIENYGVLKERLMAKGYTFESETDTEVLVKLIDSCYTGDPLRALQEAGIKVPERVSLISFNDTAIAKQVVPQLSAVTVYTEQMGSAAAEILDKELNNRGISPVPFMLKFATKLTLRGTSIN